MNQRIRELAEQAGLYDEKMPEEVPGFTACFEKFTELIISDCCRVLHNWKGEPFPFDEDLAVSLIKENFGIKE